MPSFRSRFRCYLGISYKRFIAYIRNSSKMEKERERIASGAFIQLFERERFVKTGRRPELNGRQKWSLRESWSHFVGGDPGNVGLVVFTRLFKNYPRMKDRFEFLKDDNDENKNNKRYMFHVTRVVKFIGRVLENIDHLEEVVSMIKQIGGRHGSKGYDVPAYYFTYFAEAMRQCMQEKLSEWTALHETSWREFMDWMTVQLVNGQAEYNGFRQQ